MPALLLELFSEEIPARMQDTAERLLRNSLMEALVAAGIEFSDNMETFSTPRRIAVLMKDLPDIQQDRTIERKGPKTSAPQAALDGFLRSAGVTLAQLEKQGSGKDEIYVLKQHIKGEATASLLKPLIEKILQEFSWPKSMHWGSGSTSWVRPLHSILCLFDSKVVTVEFAGITASNTTRGHRFLAPDVITIADANEYESALFNANVIASRARRQSEILKQATERVAKHQLTIKQDKGLLDEVTGLVEWPVTLIGNIDDAFMDLPSEVLISEMRAHQKYLALLKSDGAAAQQFLVVTNGIANDAVVAGNERVLRARLSDGRFFYDQDRKKTLDEWAQSLAGITFHAKIGTLAEKVARIEALAEKLSVFVIPAQGEISLATDIKRAAQLCKADLVTGMVGEFPDLQGIMGRYYALAQGEKPEVAAAIRDHYLPLGPDSAVPTAPVSIAVALADKLDTLISLFAAGEKPTGSKDPFALRRAALGIIRIILDNKLRIALRNFLNDELLAFFADRLKVQLKEQGIRHDVAQAVLASGDDDFVRIVARAQALQNFLATDDGANLLAAYKRASNIVEQAEKKDGRKYKGEIRPALLENTYEENLASALHNARETMKAFREKENFAGMMVSAAQLRPPIDNFFTHVLVNTENKEVRENRLGMLAWIRSVFNFMADFSKIEG